MNANVLVMRVQPNESISLRFEVKVPGAAVALEPTIQVTPVDMEFTYAEAFGANVSPAYETLLLDVMVGDATLFTRSDEVEAAWRVTDPLLEFWEKNPPSRMPLYTAGRKVGSDDQAARINRSLVCLLHILHQVIGLV